MFFIEANRVQRYAFPMKPPNFFSTFFVIFLQALWEWLIINK